MTWHDPYIGEETPDSFAAVEHWAFQVETPFRPVHEIMEAFSPSIERLTFEGETAYTGSPEQVAFREKVLRAHLAHSKANKGLPGRDLAPSELQPVAGTTIMMRRDAAEAAGRMIAAANAALAKARASGHPDAQWTTRIAAASGYRGSQRQAAIWRKNFEGYYLRSARHRGTLPSGPHGDEATRYMITGFRVPRWTAAPGYGNHQAGIAIDLLQKRSFGHIRNSSHADSLKTWKRTWLYEWLSKNAASFGYHPYEKEPWHWEYRPSFSPATAAGSTGRRQYDGPPYPGPMRETPGYEAAAQLESEDEAGIEGEDDAGEDEAVVEGEDDAGEDEAVVEGEDDAGEDEAGVEGEDDAGEDEAGVEGEDDAGEDEDEAGVEGEDDAAAALQLLETDPDVEMTELLQNTKQLRKVGGAFGFVFGPDLRRGVQGNSVAALQRALARLCYRTRVNGIFDSNTETAVRAFQEGAALPVTGVADTGTRKAILGVLPSAPLPKSGEALSDAIVKAALDELKLWTANGWTETDGAATPTLKKYWAAVGIRPTAQQLQNKIWQNGQPKTVKQPAIAGNPWSAAFISWVMCHAGAGDTFLYARRHLDYVQQARRNHDTENPDSPFWAYLADSVAPEPGDLICGNRGPIAPWSTILTSQGWALHCDIVTSRPSQGRLSGVGGNLSNRVSKTFYNVLPNGNIDLKHLDSRGKPDQTKLIFIIRCRGLAPGVPLSSS
jgi:peptidoglycan hydrolase-like protein with peptidoglycan-binding domain